MATSTAEAETRQRLVRNVKKEVKQIMEEAVTRKFVHEDSSHIVSFCASVEACVLHGLKRRAAGFLRSNKVAALFTKVGKGFAPAEQLCRKAQELEQLLESKRNQMGSSSESSTKLPRRFPGLSSQAARHLWIRTALIEKVLDKIVLHLVENCSKYYEKEAVLMDLVDGPILASLLVGPCALEYTKMKTADHFWTDPSADELVQRHRIHSTHYRPELTAKRPALCIQKRHSSSSIDERPSPSMSARDYVESLHQNSRATLLFGKNNVLVQPRDDMEAIPGYLSLHQTTDTMTLKWTPNQLMNGSVGDLEYEKSVYWDYAMTIRLEEIVYLHCHQQVDSGGTVVLVSQDGIQMPPLRFPQGGHLLQFLTCLENGLLPHGQLDPPLWSQTGKGKVFPKLKKKGTQESVDEEDEATDYVFRIVLPNSQSEFATTDVVDQGGNIWQPVPRKTSCSRASFSDGTSPDGCSHERTPLKLLCDNMKNQIISRAFYGWLAYCRHLSTVRTHLSALVNKTIVMPDVPCDAYGGLTSQIWQRFQQDRGEFDERELQRLVYFGGIEPSLRKEVWPFLLGHYRFGMSESEKKEVDDGVRSCYEKTMREWSGCEAIVRRREKEQHAVALAKCSSAASMDNANQRMVLLDSSVSTESSQSCNSDQQRALLQSDSSISTQIFESVDEVDQIDSEPKSDEVRHTPKVLDGSDSAQPSSVASGQSDSLSTEDSGVQDLSGKTSTQDSVTEEQNLEAKDEEAGPKNDSVRDGGSKKIRTPEPKKEKVPDFASEPERPSQVTEKSQDDVGKKKAMMPCVPVPAVVQEIVVPVVFEAFSLREMSKEPPTTDSDDSPSAIEMEDIPMARMVPMKAVQEGSSLPGKPGESEKNATTTTDASTGTTYSQELLDLYTLNLHRIEKDVQRCDRNYWYFTPANLEKLRNIMCSYVWQHLEIGYVQGMCDLLAPLLVILDDEALAYSCFTELMKRMNQNFPHGGAMDSHFASMRSLIQILDSELFELMHQNGDYTHFYFCYRWFLLDFKRELVYDDVFSVWETIWAAKHASSDHFVLFIALALVEIYRDIILENNMDFTDIIKFFNEMAEHHNVKQILAQARDLVHKIQMLIENK
ncbi:small G protein signaling modulator 1 [Trichomycterus rosablanca]|uniref:small G protein signaling modulator 1 n=1 Tax=Trichomycterus rosablanca TaxID=2290929 RepID=UPI002F352B67